MYLGLAHLDWKDTQKLEAYLREYRHASNFYECFYIVWPYVSVDFLREFSKEFKEIKRQMDSNKKWHARYNMSVKSFEELFEK